MLLENWLLMAFVAPFLWAPVVLLDVYFVHQVYKEAHEGSVITGLFQGCVFFLIPIVGFNWPGNAAGALFVTGGLAFIISIHWYFKSMVLNGDGVLVQILSNLAIVFVPVLAWFFAGEKLNLASYAGITVAFIGGVALAWDSEIREKNFTVVAKAMIPAVCLLSFSMVLQKRGYDIVGDEGFWTGFFLFSLGVVIGGMLVFLFHNERKNLFERVNSLSKKYFFVFALTESLHVAGTWTAQKAISLAPAVSLVAAIESLVPLFVMLGGFAISFCCSEKHSARAAYAKQIKGLKGKSVAMILIAAGIYLAVRG